MNLRIGVLTHAVRRVANKVAELPPDAPWYARTDRELYYELVSCILGSSVQFESALAASRALRSAGLADDFSTDEHRYETAVRKVLNSPLPSEKGTMGAYRFPAKRAAQIAGAREILFRSQHSLRSILENGISQSSVRDNLAATVPGIGPKQASLFLRNIGFTNEVAILDVHVIRYMTSTRLTSERDIRTATISGYRRTESVLGNHARQLGVVVGVLDIAIWVVMRTAARERIAWQS